MSNEVSEESGNRPAAQGREKEPDNEVFAEAEPREEEEAVGIEPYRPSTGEMMERTAEWLAKALMVVFGIVVVGFLSLSFLTLWWAYNHPPAVRGPEGSIPTFEQVMNIAQTLLPYLATPLGVALGYYFTKRGRDG